MTSQCGPRRPNLNETKMRRRYDVAYRVGIDIAALLFLINRNEKRCSKSNILTMDHELVLENSSSPAVYRLRKYQTETHLLGGPGT